MKYEARSFYYHVEGAAHLFRDFVDRLMNKLSLRGVAITDKLLEEDVFKASVKYRDERGKLATTLSGEDVKVVYEVEATGMLRRGVLGALMGGGLGTLASSIFSGDLDSIKGAIAGAVVGGAYGILDGFNTAMSEATEFSKLLAEAIREVEWELRERLEAERAAIEELNSLRRELEEVFAEAISVGDEISLMEAEDKDVSRAKVRYEAALRSLDEAERALSKGDLMMARAKVRSAARMVQLAKELLKP